VAPDNGQNSEEIGNIARWRWPFAIAVCLILFAYFVLSEFDNTTELFPDHADALNWCAALGALGALITIAFLWSQWKTLEPRQKIVAPLLAPLMGLFLFGTSSTASRLIENR
jgi:peptidoglycan/LPS O-acetylase OafA/YrhL